MKRPANVIVKTSELLEVDICELVLIPRQKLRGGSTERR